MAINWTTVSTDAATAVSGVLGAAWTNAKAGASAQLAALTSAGQMIEANQATMSQSDYNMLKLMQQRALEGVLQSYAGISIVVAEQAAAAAWGAVAGALKTAYPALGFLV